MVAARIDAFGGGACQIVVIRTSGDRLADTPLAEAGGKRLFVKEIEDALLGREIDLAVHSAKDLPTELPDGLTVAGAMPREDPRDALVLPASTGPTTSLDDVLAAFGDAPRIGTGSARRVTQLMRLLPGAHFRGIRGNLETRLRKLDDGQADGLVLAAAGLKRLGLVDRISAPLPVATCIPAPGQGIIAVETRADDDAACGAARRIDDRAAGAALTAEQALVDALGGGCQLPLGAVALPCEGSDVLDLHAIVVSLDGARVVRARGTGPLDAPEALGRTVAARLTADGARAILNEARRQQDRHSPTRRP